jgi:hypothetical protein
VAQDLFLINRASRWGRWHQSTLLSHGAISYAAPMVWQAEPRIDQGLGGFAESFLQKFCKHHHTPYHSSRIQAEKWWKSQRLLLTVWWTTCSSTWHH